LFVFTKLILILVIFLASCNKNDNVPLNTLSNNLTEAPCLPGQIEVVNGMLKFPTRQDFFTTLNFLNCASNEQVEQWRNSFNLMTAQKAFVEFSNSTCIDEEFEITEAQLSQIIQSYNGKIREVTIDGNSHFEPLFRIYNEFANLDGVFMAENSIMKVTSNELIIVTDGDFNKLSSNIVSSEHKFVIQMDVGICPGMSCPADLFRIKEYVSGSFRMVNIYNFDIQGGIFESHLAPNFYDLSLVVNMKIEGWSQRKSWFKWLCSSKSRLHHKLVSNGILQTTDIIYGNRIIDWSVSDEVQRACYISKKVPVANFGELGISYGRAKDIINSFVLCIEHVDQKQTNITDNVINDYFCL
jgi:hypothetical protein